MNIVARSVPFIFIFYLYWNFVYVRLTGSSHFLDTLEFTVWFTKLIHVCCCCRWVAEEQAKRNYYWPRHCLWTFNERLIRGLYCKYFQADYKVIRKSRLQNSSFERASSLDRNLESSEKVLVWLSWPLSFQYGCLDLRSVKKSFWVPLGLKISASWSMLHT